MKRFVELLLHVSLDLDDKQYKVYMQKTTVSLNIAVNSNKLFHTVNVFRHKIQYKNSKPRDTY